MANLSIDEAKAKAWIEDVKNELEEVRVITKNLTEVITSDPAQDDAVIKVFLGWGEKLNNCWTTMATGYRTCGEIMTGTINKIVTAVREKMAQLEELASRVGQ